MQTIQTASPDPASGPGAEIRLIPMAMAADYAGPATLPAGYWWLDEATAGTGAPGAWVLAQGPGSGWG